MKSGHSTRSKTQPHASRRLSSLTTIHNLKILIRGAKGSGKTCLFHRLQGRPIPSEYQSTYQIQVEKIQWRSNESVEPVQCELWDVVDCASSTETEIQASAFVLPQHISVISNGSHTVAPADTTTVNIYHQATSLIFILNITDWESYTYVREALAQVPRHIPIVILGNFRDKGAKRQVFKEDIEELLKAAGITANEVFDVPEPMYFECCLKNCYGLRTLHQYFGISFFHSKLGSLRQQILTVEKQLTRVKSDVQNSIMEQRYADYLKEVEALQRKLELDPSELEAREKSTQDPEDALIRMRNDAEAVDQDLPSRYSLKANLSDLKLASDDDGPDPHPSRSVFEAGMHLCHGDNNEIEKHGVNLNTEVIPLGVKLEDFRVATTRPSDLDNFYSDEEDDHADYDVIISPKRRIAQAKGAHKQAFLDSDVSSDEMER
ncbi:unnamed protein product [Albugo candida]|uniref:GTP-binding protein Parf n=1 Tax=Albugo candida TaxID=65357 RepID=A0A024G794_9STRA|nr:unnamed protein product [Albugo candida]|eukprot:CCI42379.1 unnamed protein product [Albugo candida]